MPIPEGGKIIIEIILFRLPCTLSPFYKIETNRYKNNSNYNINNQTKNIRINNSTIISNNQKTSSKPTTMKDINNEDSGSININIRKKLKKIKNISLGKYAIPNISSPLNSDREGLNINIQNQNSINPVKKNNQGYYEESNLNTLYYEKLNDINQKINKSNEIHNLINNSSVSRDELISNALNLNIPIKLRIEIERIKNVKKL